MKLLLPVLFLLQTQAHAADPASWFRCEGSDDCTLAKGPCGAATAVNRVYRGKFEKSAKNTKCEQAVDFKKDRKTKGAGCSLENKCVTITRKE